MSDKNTVQHWVSNLGSGSSHSNYINLSQMFMNIMLPFGMVYSSIYSGEGYQRPDPGEHETQDIQLRLPLMHEV